MIKHIDLNADLGEGGSCDHNLLALVSSANISCGAHAGNTHDIRAAIQRALELGVSIGAHPSYPDREHWGRRSMQLSAQDLRTTLTQQLQWLASEVSVAGGRLQHVKPHGALYNDAAKDPVLATLVAECVKTFDPALRLVGLAGSVSLSAAQQLGLNTIAEAFVDRRYQTDGTLVPRSDSRALITDVQQALRQSLAIIAGEPIEAVDGTAIVIKAQTLCVHGETEHALVFARQLRQALDEANILIRAPADGVKVSAC